MWIRVFFSVPLNSEAQRHTCPLYIFQQVILIFYDLYLMGQGGYINFINGTPYDWIMSMPTKPYQMKAWSFPDKIRSGITATVYIEWGQGIFVNDSNDAGNVTFTVGSTKNSFELQARKLNGAFTLLMYLAIDSSPPTSLINLGFIHNGAVNFILSGSSGNFKSSSVPVSWMQNNISTLGSRPLHKICMPGTHNAGMSKKTSGTAFPSANNTLCQSLSILGQLFAGSRYFDIRPIISGAQFFTGHYSRIDVPIIGSTWQGWNGQSIIEIIDQINAFTAVTNELVILNLTHDCNTDTEYRPFSDEEWRRLFEQLLGLKNLFIPAKDTPTVLADLPLNTFIAGGKAAVIVLVEPNKPIGAFANSGFFSVSQLRVYDQYANTVKQEEMIQDQLKKMRTRPADDFFVLSWTLTQNSLIDITFSDLKKLSEDVNTKLYTKLVPECTKQAYPNAIFINFLKGGNHDVAALALAVNNLLGS